MQKRLQRSCACGKMRMSASEPPRRGRSDGYDGILTEPRGQGGRRPRGQCCKRYALPLACASRGDGSRRERELAALARARPRGVDMLSADRDPLAGRAPDTGPRGPGLRRRHRSEEHTSELQSRPHLVCRLLLEKKKKIRERPQRQIPKKNNKNKEQNNNNA